MNESSYGSELANDIEKGIGGKVIKISDRSTLGLPDYVHLMGGISTYIETKIGDQFTIEGGLVYVQPWKIVKKDIRQYEVCRSMSFHTLVVYAFYWPVLRKSLVLKMSHLAQLKPSPGSTEIPWFNNTSLLKDGRGVPQLAYLMEKNKREIHASLEIESLVAK